MEQAAAASCREDDREKKAQQRRPPQGFRLLGALVQFRRPANFFTDFFAVSKKIGKFC